MIWLARSIWLLAVALAATNILLGVLFPRVFAVLDSEQGPGMVLFATIALVGIGYATSGMLILRQRIRHSVGWLLLVSGPLFVAVFTCAVAGALLHEAAHPAAPWVLVFASYGWVPAIVLAGPLLALTFPDGRLPGPKWRPVVTFIFAVFALTFVAVVLRPGPVGGIDDAPANPLGAPFIPEWVFSFLEATGIFVLVFTLLTGVAAVITRFRTARAEERQQLKWFAFAVIVWGLLLPPSFFIEAEEFAIVAIGALVLVPASVVIAITRYRLYEIDTLINRTLVYVPLVGIVAGLYAACVVLFQRVFVATTGNTSDAAAIISALILAAVFTPIRKAIEGVVDSRFKPAPAAGSSARPWDDPDFEAAVERVARRVLAERR